MTIRFTTDNAGPWFLHWYVLASAATLSLLILITHFDSHIDWHLEVGLAIVFAEDAADWDDQTIPSK